MSGLRALGVSRSLDHHQISAAGPLADVPAQPVHPLMTTAPAGAQRLGPVPARDAGGGEGEVQADDVWLAHNPFGGRPALVIHGAPQRLR